MGTFFELLLGNMYGWFDSFYSENEFIADSHGFSDIF